MNLSLKVQLKHVRCYCNSKNADFIKRWNFDNKQLFGKVEKKKEKKTAVKQSNEIIKDWDRGASEMHWLLKKEMKPTNRLGRKANNKMPPSAKPLNTINEIVSPAKPISQSIPFSEQGLKDLLNFPLISDSLSLKPTFDQSYSPSAEMLPSVSKILQATIPESARRALLQWKLMKIEELGEDGFQALKKTNFEKGSIFHNFLQNYFNRGETPSEKSEDFGVWQSVSPVLKHLDPTAVFVEQPVVHPDLKYKGIVDCVGRIGDELVIVEWKKSDRVKPSLATTYDAPLQLCAYLGALNSNPKYEVDAIKRGMVVVAYKSGQPAECFKLDENELRRYWGAWLLRLQEYWIRHRDGTLPEPI